MVIPLFDHSIFVVQCCILVLKQTNKPGIIQLTKVANWIVLLTVSLTKILSSSVHQEELNGEIRLLTIVYTIQLSLIIPKCISVSFGVTKTPGISFENHYGYN